MVDIIKTQLNHECGVFRALKQNDDRFSTLKHKLTRIGPRNANITIETNGSDLQIFPKVSDRSGSSLSFFLDTSQQVIF